MIEDNDAEWQRLLANVEELVGTSVEVGVFAEGKGAAMHGDSGFTVAQIAAVHELGAGNVPARPFVQPAMDQGRDSITRQLRDTAIRILDGKDVDSELDAFGAFGAALVQAYIRENDIPPPLAQSTIDAKGSSRALINTGQMVAAIAHRVKD